MSGKILVDYTDLESRIGEIESVSKSGQSYIFNKVKSNPFLYIVCFLMAVSLEAVFVYSFIKYPSRAVAFLCYLIPAGVVYFFGMFFARMQEIFMMQVAEKLGYLFSKFGAINTGGVLFGFGHDNLIYNVLSGTYKNIPIRLYDYLCEVGSGKNKKIFKFTVFEAEFETNLPDIVLLDHHGFFSISLSSEVPDYVFKPSLKNKNKLNLEGNFNDYFQLYVPKELEIEALQIFTPDVMADFIDNFKGLNFEVCGKKMYVFSEKIITNKDEILLMHRLFVFLSDKLHLTLEKIGASN